MFKTSSCSLAATCAALALSCATDDAGTSPPPDDDVLETPLADIRVPVAGTKDSYRFRFFAADAATTIAVVMDVPIGAPQPELPDECPLDTFLRVAPDDALVPPALLAACGRAADAAVPHTAGELDTAHLALAIGPAALTGPLCTREAFDSRAVALAKDASYVPKIQSCDQECVWGEVWDQTSCAVVDGDGNFLGWCDPGVYADLLEFVGPYGEYCEEYQPVNCQWVPNPACDPTVATYPDWGPWLDWQRFSTFPTTAMRVETSVCGPDGASAYWQDKAKSGDAWGVKHTFAIPGNYISVLTLHAGWDANGTYLGRYYLGHVSGFGFHVASAWLGMVGDPHLSCPLKI